MQDTSVRGTAALLPRSRAGGGRRARGAVALTVAGLMGVGGLTALGTGVAAAAVPSFPDNVVVFPDRDFVTIEGYQDHLGETALVEVKRAGVVIGSAQSVVGPGDVAFEINHPGGVCWGAGTTHKVTPDIQPGDVVSIDFGVGEPDSTTTADAYVSSDATLDGNTLTVKGHIGADVDPDQFEQRIINPDLVTTDVARRDIRAVPGPMAVAPKGGYSSNVTFAGDTFTATYVFNNSATAQIAAASGGERAMSWQNEDADANRQGLTIAEHGELGGPGMGGCPAGPTDQAPPAGSFVTARNVAKDKLQVSWTPVTPGANAAAVTGYSVEAIAPSANGVATTVGARTGATTKSVTLTVDPNATFESVEVRSLAGAKMGEPFKLSQGTGGTGTIPSDQTIPALTFNPAAGTETAPAEADLVTLGSEFAADIYYTTGDKPAIDGDLPSDSATLYTKPIAITGTEATKLHAVAFDRAGNFREAVSYYKPATAAKPLAAPTGLKATAGEGSVKLDWAAVTGATSYQVTVSPAITPPPAPTTSLTQTITGLTGGTTYTFNVTAIDGTRTSPASASVTSTPSVVTARVTISTGRWKNGDTRIQGTTNTAANAGTIKFYRWTNGTRGAVLFTDVASPLTAAVAPATGSAYDARFRNTAQTGTTNPGTVVAVLANGTEVLGTSAPFTLANG